MKKGKSATPLTCARNPFIFELRDSAEAYYGVPEDIYNEAYSRLSPHFKNVIKEFEDKYGRKIV